MNQPWTVKSMNFCGGWKKMKKIWNSKSSGGSRKGGPQGLHPLFEFKRKWKKSMRWKEKYKESTISVTCLFVWFFCVYGYNANKHAYFPLNDPNPIFSMPENQLFKCILSRIIYLNNFLYINHRGGEFCVFTL